MTLARRLPAIFLLLALSCFGVCGDWALAAEPVRIAVLAFRPKPVAQVQWQPLALALKAAIPERDFVVQTYTLSELEAVVTSRQADFVLTNPGQYVLLTRRSGLLAPLATVLMDESGRETSAFGGVMFTRARYQTIQSLAALKGKSVAAVGQDSLGGYQMQAFELLQAGVDVRRDNRLMLTGMPQDKVVDAVLSGQADVGFVRSGLLEAMAREGKLDMTQVTVLNAQKFNAFPVKSSTALYPEWPFSYLAHVDDHLARQVTAALFLIAGNAQPLRSTGIRGFTVPADYTPVADLLRALRMPPFDVAPAFTWRDVVVRYQWPLVASAIAMVLILLLSLRLWLAGRRLSDEKQRVVQQAQMLQTEVAARQASEAAIAQALGLLRSIIDHVPVRIFWKDRDLRYLGCNTLFAQDGGVNSSNEVIGKDDFQLAWAAQAAAYRADDQAVMDSGMAKLFFDEKQATPQGGQMWLRTSKVPLRGEDQQVFGVLGIYEDVTERKVSEEKLQLAASVFSSAREGIFITDAAGAILDTNHAFTLITGYDRSEVLGLSPHMLSSGLHAPSFFNQMYADLQAKDHWYGEVCERRKNGEMYVEMLTISAVRDNQGQITHYVAMFFDITTLKEHQRQLEHLAHFDALTNLPNRVLLADRMHQAMVQSQRRGTILAVAYLDLDGFKHINDTYGHDAGDQLLIAVSGAVRQTLREGDTLARIGGDEFVAVLSDLSDMEDCTISLQRVLAAAGQPMPFGELQLQVSASLGVTFFPQSESVDADQLMRQADQAMYQAKLAGKNRFHVFDAAQDRNSRGMHERMEEIAGALAQCEFVLFYQPKVNLRTGQVVGAEALIRWQHPLKGLLSPGQFLPVIENHALSVALGDWVVDSALAQMAQWQSLGLVLPVSVNVSARQLQHDDFVDKLQAALSRHADVAPALLSMEVLETSVLEDLGRTAKIIADCARLGVSFALDDFGTGYSSLTYLKHLPVTLIKIDQSFVGDMLDDLDDLAILQGVISLARAFKREVIAEGMETTEHGTRLLQLGCELAQGYGLARPMPAADVPDWVATWRPDPEWSQVQALAD
jgi:diguanylate cyclase (GGDEF)-like protein/PAS domain S-box-containing protein